MSIRLVVLALVVSAGDLVAQSSPPKRQIVEDLRLDATAEDFPDVGPVTVGPRGQIVVPISNDQQLRIYDATGKKTATFGRKGSGPGEFRRATWFGWTGDTLWVYDTDLRRVTYVSPAATLIRTEGL